MDQEAPPPTPPPPSDSAPTQEHAVATTLTRGIQPGSTSVPEPSLERNSAAPSHGIQRAGPSFLDLPAEIRNMIYTWLFPTGRSAVKLLARHRGGYIDMGDCLGLLTTCRQVYDEVSSLLRTERRFVVVQPKTILCLFQSGITIQETLFGYICPDDTLELSYDLDKGTKKKAISPIFDTCKELRQTFLQHSIVKINVTTSPSDQFEDLEEWTRSGCSYLEATGSPLQYINVILRVPKTDKDGSTNHRFSAVHLFRAAKDLIPYAELAVVAADEDEAHVQPLCDLADLSRRLLIFVHNLRKSSKDPVNQPIPRIWLDKDLQVSHAEIEDDGRIVRVPNDLSKYTSGDLHDEASRLKEFYYGRTVLGPEDGNAAAPELTAYVVSTIYPRDSLVGLAEELADAISMGW